MPSQEASHQQLPDAMRGKQFVPESGISEGRWLRLCQIVMSTSIERIDPVDVWKAPRDVRWLFASLLLDGNIQMDPASDDDEVADELRMKGMKGSSGVQAKRLAETLEVLRKNKGKLVPECNLPGKRQAVKRLRDMGKNILAAPEAVRLGRACAGSKGYMLVD